MSSLAAAAKSHPGRPLPWEDVFITGILGEKVAANKFYHLGISTEHRKRDPCSYANAFTGHDVTPEEMLWLWQESKKMLR